jgi:hypothetical protein
VFLQTFAVELIMAILLAMGCAVCLDLHAAL